MIYIERVAFIAITVAYLEYNFCGIKIFEKKKLVIKKSLDWGCIIIISEFFCGSKQN